MKLEDVKKMNISQVSKVLIELTHEMTEHKWPFRQRICWQFPKSVSKKYQNELLDRAVVLQQKMERWAEQIHAAIDQPDLPRENRAYEIAFYERIKAVIDGTGRDSVSAVYNEIDDRIKQLKKKNNGKAN